MGCVGVTMPPDWWLTRDEYDQLARSLFEPEHDDDAAPAEIVALEDRRPS